MSLDFLRRKSVSVICEHGVDYMIRDRPLTAGLEHCGSAYLYSVHHMTCIRESNLVLLDSRRETVNSGNLQGHEHNAYVAHRTPAGPIDRPYSMDAYCVRGDIVVSVQRAASLYIH